MTRNVCAIFDFSLRLHPFRGRRHRVHDVVADLRAFHCHGTSVGATREGPSRLWTGSAAFCTADQLENLFLIVVATAGGRASEGTSMTKDE